MVRRSARHGVFSLGIRPIAPPSGLRTGGTRLEGRLFVVSFRDSRDFADLVLLLAFVLVLNDVSLELPAPPFVSHNLVIPAKRDPNHLTEVDVHAVPFLA